MWKADWARLRYVNLVAVRDIAKMFNLPRVACTMIFGQFPTFN